eukprot:scaffold5221_cov18-Prasinocladus_malaysianus.AAC.3
MKAYEYELAMEYCSSCNTTDLDKSILGTPYNACWHPVHLLRDPGGGPAGAPPFPVLLVVHSAAGGGGCARPRRGGHQGSPQRKPEFTFKPKA